MPSKQEIDAAIDGVIRLHHPAVYRPGYPIPAHVVRVFRDRYLKLIKAALTAAEEARTDALMEAKRVTDELMPEARTEQSRERHEASTIAAFAETGQQTSDEGAGSSNAPDRSGESMDRAFVGASATDPPAENVTPSSVGIPDEAVEAAMPPVLGAVSKLVSQEVGRRLATYAPAIRADTLAKVRERVEAVRKPRYDQRPALRLYNLALDHALTAIDKGADDGR